MSRAGNRDYVVQFKDEGVWFDGSVPVRNRTARDISEHYADGGFQTRIVPDFLAGQSRFCNDCGADIDGNDPHNPDCPKEAS